MVITAQSPSSAVQLDSIRFSPGTAPSIDPLLIGSESDLLAAKRRSAPVAHMIREPDIGRLMTFAGCIVDCGTQKRTGKKGKTIELSRYLLKKGGKIPLIRAVYRKPGRAQQGIEQLLNKAYEKEDKNLYIVAVHSHIYEGLLKQMWEKRKHKPSHALFMQRISDDPELAGKYVGRTREYVNVRKNILVAADGDLPVLIIGESGTGKEIVARCIHERSRRNKTGVFAAVNSAAIPGDLLEEELFGIEPGVVSGVSRLKKGLWEIADHGTIFLDEIGEMSLEHQRKILRVLQDGIIRRVGGTVDIQVDARVIAATNSDLKELIAQKKFREDLYYRLCVFTIYTPVLTSDALEHIAQECWRSVTGGTKPPLSGEIIKLLAKYALAGNVRTVKNVLKKLNAYMTAEGLNRIGRKYFEAAMRALEWGHYLAVARTVNGTRGRI